LFRADEVKHSEKKIILLNLYYLIIVRSKVMKKNIQNLLAREIEAIKAAGTYKAERIITSPQSSKIRANNKDVLNFCANNYLGLSNHPRLI